jgi:protein-disulfide isomerase
MVAQSRKSPPPARRQAANTRFLAALALIVVAGAVTIAGLATRKTAPVVQNVDPATLGPAQGYLLGKADAPVQIQEFADFECPACGTYALVTEPDVRKRLVDAGLASYRYFDFPLPMHHNTWFASHAAACANDQGKFWEMHDRLFAGQLDWRTEVTGDPSKIMVGYARDLGLDMDKWQKCFDSQAHLRDIQANKAEGERRHVNQTPTFIVGTRLVAGAMTYDQMKAYVDSAATPAKRVAAK